MAARRARCRVRLSQLDKVRTALDWFGMQFAYRAGLPSLGNWPLVPSGFPLG